MKNAVVEKNIPEKPRAEHSPAPFDALVTINQKVIWVNDASGRTVADCTLSYSSSGPLPVDEQIANAHLFAAAPDMLAALKAIVNCWVAECRDSVHASGKHCAHCGCDEPDILHSGGCLIGNAEAAIAKAQGGAQ